MEVFIAFIKSNVPIVVITAIAVVGIIGVSTALIILKIRDRRVNNKLTEARDLESE